MKKKPLQPASKPDQVMPLVEERLVVGKRAVETGRVIVHKKVVERTVPVDLDLLSEEVAVEHVPIGREVERPEPIRQEGETLVIPLHEEITVIEKKLVLKEELRVVRHRTVRRERVEESLRSEELAVERQAPAQNEGRPVGPSEKKG